jgi:LacI family transcriptional regulator
MMTVSRAINGREGINQETRDRILKIASELDYRPSQIARGLVTRQTTTLGLVMPDVANPFFAQIARGAEDVAYTHDYNLFLINTAEDLEREKRAVNSLLEKDIDGAIICSSRLEQNEIISFIEKLPAAVLVNRELSLPESKVATLNVNDCNGAMIAIDYLVNKGRKQIAMIAGPKLSISSQRRLDGYKTGLQNHGIKYSLDFVEHCFPTTQGGENAAIALLERCPDVDAILAFNDLVAIGVLRACLAKGKSVPQDIAIIGADDIPLAALTNPSLTTLHVDLNALGEQAMLALLQLINSPLEAARKIVVQPELKIRESA